MLLASNSILFVKCANFAKYENSNFRLVFDHFDAVTKKTSFKDHRFIAGIIMMINEDINSAKVVAIATGCKLTLANTQSIADGTIVNDLHAEIVARRCLLNYLYSQLELHSNDGMYVILKNTMCNIYG